MILKMEVNPLIWYGFRQLDPAPPHFLKSSTPATNDSIFWVRTKLSGRFAVQAAPYTNLEIIFDLHPYVYFEDPKELMLYELRWSGSK